MRTVIRHCKFGRYAAKLDEPLQRLDVVIAHRDIGPVCLDTHVIVQVGSIDVFA